MIIVNKDEVVVVHTTMTATTMEKAQEASQTNQGWLQFYYDHLFPFADMYKWISYGDSTPTSTFSRREFSMTLTGDTYLRFKSYKVLDDWRNDVRKMCPIKLDLGGIYNAKPSQRSAAKDLICIEKEFCIDIDLTDYDDVRTCCSSDRICERCWLFAVAGMKVIDRILKNVFAFESLFWVFSGRRGVHCWVCDPIALSLTSDQRSHLVAFMSVYEGNQNQSKKVNLHSPLHPTLYDAYTTLEPYFVKIMIMGEGLLRSSDRWGFILNMIPDVELRQQIANHFEQHYDKQDCLTRWKLIKNEVENKAKNSKVRHQYRWDLVLPEIVFTYTYPRLDVNVSKQLNHLLKMPFCVHPKTGLVCVPIDMEKISEFSPFTVPSLKQLYAEMHDDDARGNSLVPYIKFFRKVAARAMKQDDAEPDLSF